MRAIRALCAAGLTLLLAVAVGARDLTPKDPPGTAFYVSQLRALFDQWDTNSDGYLDKQELAVAFRGAGARPFDYKKPEKSVKEDAEETKTPAKSDSEKDRPANTTPAKKPDYSTYPDYLFLVQLDTDTDDKISRDEFMTWARDYAVQLKACDDQAKQLLAIETKLAAQQKKLADAQAKLAAATTKAEVKKLQKLVDKETKAIADLNKQAAGAKGAMGSPKNYESALGKALKR